MSAPQHTPPGSWRAAKRAAKRSGGRPEPLDDSIAAPAPQSPLDFALSVMRDATKPDALRVSVAKAALPYVHGRWSLPDSGREEERPKPPPPFDLPDPYNSLSVEWRDAIDAQVGSTRLAPLNALISSAAAAADKASDDSLSRHGRNTPGHDDNKERAAAEARLRELEARATAAEATVARVEAERRALHDELDAMQNADMRDLLRERAALEKRATLAEGRLREAELRAHDMQERACAAEALIAGRR